jgi:hypothetical protein
MSRIPTPLTKMIFITFLTHETVLFVGTFMITYKLAATIFAEEILFALAFLSV